jgi:hypothetical protein
MHRTKVIDGVIYFSDNDRQGLARVGSLVVASGKETVLTSEKVAVDDPNQLPDPTSPSVTLPAGAGDVPSVAADH